MADPDEALIEAIARDMFADDCEADGVSAEDRDWLWADCEEPVVSETYTRKARAAYAAMVAHLGLVEERKTHERTGPGKCSCGFDAYRNAGIMADYTALTQAHFRAVRLGKVPTGRRLVSRWVEVDHGSE